MNGETSQEVMTDDLFDDIPELEETIAEGAETETPAETDAEKPEEADDLNFLTIRYNKADVQLSKKEAIELAQKGKNYDHVANELKSYREGPIGKALKLYADEAGMSVEAYADMMIQQQDAAMEKAAMEKLEQEHPEWPEEAIKELVKAQRAGAKEQKKSADEQKRQKEWAEARAAYPDVNPESIPQDVLEAINDGATPLEALRMNELAQLRAKVAELTKANETKQKQKDNRERSIGPAAGNQPSSKTDIAKMDIEAGLNWNGY